MSVQTRHIRSVTVGSLNAMGTVRDGSRICIGFAAGHLAKTLRSELGPDVILNYIGQSVLASVEATGTIKADPAELELFEGKSTLLAFRNGETAKAASDWANYHAIQHGAEAALIFDRDPPEGWFAEKLEKLVPNLPIVVVNADSPMGLRGAPDARHVGLAPAAPQRPVPPVDPWHGALGQFVIYELLKRRFLASAKAVAAVEISDLVAPLASGTLFDVIEQSPGQAQVLVGHGCYPWRLRQGKPAAHGDHIATLRDDAGWISSWGVVPATLPSNAFWRPGRILNAPASKAEMITFRRALGVAFPAVPVADLVRKSELVENPELLAMMKAAFRSEPVRLPKPRSIPPRPESSQVTIVSAMKNEGPFILDWIAHNRAIGIDRHLVYTNECADGTDHLLDLLRDAGVERRDNPYSSTGKVPQYAAFAAAEDEAAVKDADWLLTLDVDEFINIHVGAGRISDLMSSRPDAHLFSMPWRLFGNADQLHFEDRPVTERFTRAAPEFAPRPLQAWAFKTLYRNVGLFRRLGVHRPKGLHLLSRDHISWVNGSGQPMPSDSWQTCWRVSKQTWGYDLVTLNHYAVRSAESFLVKRERGRVNHVDRDQGLAYWFRMNHNAVEDRSILRLATAVNSEKAALLALPGVAEAHAAAVDWHQKRIAFLREVPEQAELFSRITSPRLENLSRMATKFGAYVHFHGPDVIPGDIADRDPEDDFFFSIDGSTDQSKT